MIQVEKHGNQYGWNRCICPDCKCQFVFNHLDFRIWSMPDSITRIVECPECGRDVDESEWYFKAAAIDYLMTNMCWRDEDGYEVDNADEKRAIITDLLNGVPSVDAVPVKWISAYMNQAYGRVRAEIIREMLDAWMEQEAR